MTDAPEPRPPAGLRRVREVRRPDVWAARLRGPWRVAVADGSMRPTIEPGDWLLLDPTVDRWPRRGSIVVFREPMSDLLAIKRLAGRPGDRVPFAGGRLELGDDEAWLLSDTADDEAIAAGDGRPVDSRRYGPVPIERLVARAWWRYGPIRRLGPLGAGPPLAKLLERGLTAPGPPPTAYGPVDIDALLGRDRPGG